MTQEPIDNVRESYSLAVIHSHLALNHDCHKEQNLEYMSLHLFLMLAQNTHEYSVALIELSCL